MNAVIDLHRMAFGPRPGDLDAWNALSGDDNARHLAYVEQQLHPETIDDSAVDQRLTAFPSLKKSQEALWRDYYAAGGGDHTVYQRPLRETILATFVRAVHSRRQLLEVLADFWHNHFNVFAFPWEAAAVWPYYDREVIRGHVLGNFRAMLEAVASSTAMLYYLDNIRSTDAGPNENFARELFELHTLGATNYLGVRGQEEVPKDSRGRPTAYVDNDVYEAARAFTGWTTENGRFVYRAEWHDRFQKQVLGLAMGPDRPDLQDGRDVLDAVAHHPGTARHIAEKLCRRLIADRPPAAVIENAAAVFLDRWEAPDQLRQVVRAILRSDEYRATWGEKSKRPFETAVALLRATDGDLPFTPDDSLTNDFLWLYRQTGHELFARQTPDGYPDTREAWNDIGSRATTWRLIGWLMEQKAGERYLVDAAARTPDGVRSAADIADFWILRLLGRPMEDKERREIVRFMAQGYQGDLDLPLNEETRSRLQSMVALIAMSPAFSWR